MLLLSEGNQEANDLLKCFFVVGVCEAAQSLEFVRRCQKNMSCNDVMVSKSWIETYWNCPESSHLTNWSHSTVWNSSVLICCGLKSWWDHAFASCGTNRFFFGGVLGCDIDVRCGCYRRCSWCHAFASCGTNRAFFGGSSGVWYWRSLWMLQKMFLVSRVCIMWH